MLFLRFYFSFGSKSNRLILMHTQTTRLPTIQLKDSHPGVIIYISLSHYFFCVYIYKKKNLKLEECRRNDDSSHDPNTYMIFYSSSATHKHTHTHTNHIDNTFFLPKFEFQILFDPIHSHTQHVVLHTVRKIESR